MKKNPTEFTQFEYSLSHEPDRKGRLPSIDENKPMDSVAINISSRKSSKDYTDSEMHNILSESMVQPTRRRRMSSTRLSVDEGDIIEQTVEPTVTRHQMKQAVRKMSRTMSKDSFKNLPVVSEDNNKENDEKGYINAAFVHDNEHVREEDKILKDLDRVIDNVKVD